MRYNEVSNTDKAKQAAPTERKINWGSSYSGLPQPATIGRPVPGGAKPISLTIKHG
jgi:hypothetical protein